jgi:hypothetical protein
MIMHRKRIPAVLASPGKTLSCIGARLYRLWQKSRGDEVSPSEAKAGLVSYVRAEARTLQMKRTLGTNEAEEKVRAE